MAVAAMPFLLLVISFLSAVTNYVAEFQMIGAYQLHFVE